MSMLEKQIERRILETKTKNSLDYLDYIKRNHDEYSKLIDGFHINISHFFRNPMVFNFIESYIIPEHFSGNPDTIRVWSAGCASGQEPYSFAILLEEYLLKENFAPKVFFFATDSDHNALKKAKKGIYSYDQIDECKLKIINKYFQNTNGKYHINDSVKQHVLFHYYNLLHKASYSPKESIFGSFDIIFCRNVLIYFNEEYHDLIFKKLHRSINMGGYLILGESETIPVKYSGKYTRINNLIKIYRRIN